MAELIPVGNSAEASADIVIASGGDPVTLFLKTTSGGPVPLDASVVVQAKADDVYNSWAVITGADPCKVLDATGTFRVYRPGQTAIFGVEQG